MLNKKFLSLIQDVAGCNHMSPAEAVDGLQVSFEKSFQFIKRDFFRIIVQVNMFGIRYNEQLFRITGGFVNVLRIIKRVRIFTCNQHDRTRGNI